MLSLGVVRVLELAGVHSCHEHEARQKDRGSERIPRLKGY
jgi:hypothetical protein